MLKIIFHPVSQFNLLVCGSLIAIGVIHNHAHQMIEMDVHAYVRQYCKKNPEVCKSYVDNGS
jgi:formyltetrahydrofolate synthetase